MKRVTGIGGIFFKARDPQALRAWYRRHLGLAVEAVRSTTGSTSDHGRFGWVTDPEGHRVERWQSPEGR